MSYDQQQYREWYESGKWREITIDERPPEPAAEPVPEPIGDDSSQARLCAWSDCERELSKRQKRLCRMHANTERQRRTRNYWRRNNGNLCEDDARVVMAISERWVDPDSNHDTTAFEVWQQEQEDSSAYYHGFVEARADVVECLTDDEQRPSHWRRATVNPAVPATQSDDETAPLTVTIRLNIIDARANQMTAGSDPDMSDDIVMAKTI